MMVTSENIAPMDVDSDSPVKRLDKGKGKVVAPPVAEVGANHDNLPWVEKYRPKDLSDLVSHKDITSTIMRFIDENRLPHLLLYGPPGTGKTSTILACARKLYGPQYKNMILELNASDDRGIDVVREQIKNFASTKKIFSTGFKLIILDEADAMTQQAQAALRRIIEKYTKNVRFCMICNYVSKIIPALQSRCTRFRFHPLEQDQIEERLNYICKMEGVSITDDGKKALMRLSNGDMRRALNVLQSTAAAYDTVTEEKVYFTTGSPLPSDIEKIAYWLLNEDFSVGITNLNTMRIEKGYALQDILTDLHSFISLIELPRPAKVFLYDKLADIEYKLSTGASERIQMGGLVGAFKVATEIAAKASA